MDLGRILDDHDALSSGMKSQRMLSRVSFARARATEIRMFVHADLFFGADGASSINGAELDEILNGEMLAVNFDREGYPTLAAGGITPPRLPSGNRASRMGLDSEISSPKSRAMFLRAT